MECEQLGINEGSRGRVVEEILGVSLPCGAVSSTDGATVSSDEKYTGAERYFVHRKLEGRV